MLLVDWSSPIVDLGITWVAESICLPISALTALYCCWPLLALVALYEERLHRWIWNGNIWILIISYSCHVNILQAPLTVQSIRYVLHIITREVIQIRMHPIQIILISVRLWNYWTRCRFLNQNTCWLHPLIQWTRWVCWFLITSFYLHIIRYCWFD